MPLLDLYASHEHYMAHLAPIWRALPPEVRGDVLRPATLHREAMERHRPVLVASLADYTVMGGRPVVYVEHGAGQTYDGDPGAARHGSYPGGRGLERVVLFLCPSDRVAGAWASARYGARVEVVGSPWLDQLTGLTSSFGARDEGGERGSPQAVDGPVGDIGCGISTTNVTLPRVAFTFHWNCRLVPETTSALPHYHGHLARVVTELRCLGHEVDGHGHPRMWPTLEPIWRKLRVAPRPRFADVVSRSTVLVGDNTSALYEWAALDRPVVVLNAPWYRRDVDHGLRFWNLVPGRQVDEPDELLGAIHESLMDPDATADLRSRATAEVYAHRDGRAADRAATAILEVLDHG